MVGCISAEKNHCVGFAWVVVVVVGRRKDGGMAFFKFRGMGTGDMDIA